MNEDLLEYLKWLQLEIVETMRILREQGGGTNGN